MEERLALLRGLMPPEDRDRLDDETALALLQAAGDAVLNRLWPFDRCRRDVPERYHTLQCRVALELWSKQGAEGQTYHAENGVTRTWETGGGVSSSLLNAIPPFVGGVVSCGT